MVGAVGVGVAALSVLASVLGAARGSSASASTDPSFHVDGRRVVSKALKLEMSLPEIWMRLDVPAQPGSDFLFQQKDTNTVLGGYGLAPDEHDVNLESTLDRMLDQKRQKWGALESIRWDDDSFAGLDWKTLSFSMIGPTGPVRNKLWVAKKAGAVVGFTCSGAVPTFAESDRRCSDVIHRLEAR
ncbi:hypothetical protein AKJ09_01516 [Labilithrix luteola]|uniref:Uncharacterized protein n=1 Tax=Labilithrix luteola TaxID=1391654 RepID=A0A0K1PMV8_9BACT|nr:hypothetical protein AKJ09_01516 [Labilithrix luteola]